MPFPVTADLALAAYIALCLISVLVVHSFSIFDQRELARELDADLQPVSFFERPDRALLILLFGIMAMGISAYAGWRVPEEIQRLFPAGLLGVGLEAISEPLARAAQVVGATCFLMMALRMLRLSLIIAFAVTLMMLSVAAYTYVFT